MRNEPDRRSARSSSPTASPTTSASPKGKRVLSDGAGLEVTKILEQNVTGRHRHEGAAIGCPAAGKTGTTDSFKDAWFVGYTPTLATLGLGRLPQRQHRDAGRRRAARLPAPIWHDYMTTAHGDDCNDFPQPKQPAELLDVLQQQSRRHERRQQRQRLLLRATPSGPAADGNDSSPATQQGGGGRGYDPRLYEAPPQPAPRPQPAPAARPSPRARAAAANGNGKRRRQRRRRRRPLTVVSRARAHRMPSRRCCDRPRPPGGGIGR